MQLEDIPGAAAHVAYLLPAFVLIHKGRVNKWAWESSYFVLIALMALWHFEQENVHRIDGLVVWWCVTNTASPWMPHRWRMWFKIAIEPCGACLVVLAIQTIGHMETNTVTYVVCHILTGLLASLACAALPKVPPKERPADPSSVLKEFLLVQNHGEFGDSGDLSRRQKQVPAFFHALPPPVVASKAPLFARPATKPSFPYGFR